MRKQLFYCILVSFLSACGGENSLNESTEPQGVVPNYTQLKTGELRSVQLKLSSQAELETYLKNGIRLLMGVNYHTLVNTANTPPDSPQPASDDFFEGRENQGGSADNGLNNGSIGFSETNVHEVGIDEADYVKYDGQTIYSAIQQSSDPIVEAGTAPAPQISIAKTHPDTAEAEIVGKISTESGHWGWVDELYLVKDENNSTSELATLRTSWGGSFMRPMPVDVSPTTTTDFVSALPSYYSSPEVQVTLYDVKEPTTPEKTWTIEVEGRLNSSRKIGNVLYLVTNFSPSIPYIYHDNSNEAKIANEQAIVNTDLEDLLPHVKINEGEPRPLVESQRCLISADSDSVTNIGYRNIVSIVAIDLEEKEITSSVCLNSHVDGIYMSADSLYLGGSSYDFWTDDTLTFGKTQHTSFSVFHKFLLADRQINYRSTGVVPGVLSWRDPSFRMNEYKDNFRVVTTSTDEQNMPKHRLTILKDDDDSDTMTVVSVLPNEAQPQNIGKPNEDIYAVRFMGDRSFVVTFQRTDPLYVIDLSDMAAPRISGELEVLGFSSYLHPLGKDYLLGIGQEATIDGVIGGVKASLFNISDIAAPLEVSSVSIGDIGSYSSAIHDLRAISFLKASDNQLRFSLPINVNAANYQWQHTALYLFEINGFNDNDLTLTQTGEIISGRNDGSRTRSSFTGRERSVLHNEAVYYIHGKGILSAFWSSPDAVNTVRVTSKTRQ